MSERSLPWEQLTGPVSGLPTDEPHRIDVQREAIPLIFVPGVMGSRLRRAGSNATGRRTEHGFDLPDLRWDPGDSGFLWELLRSSAAKRKMLVIGPQFDPGYLEVDDANPVGDGFQGLFSAYRGFLRTLRTRDWGALGKLFVFPVYGFGYNWTDDNRNSGRRLAARIDEVIAEARSVVGRCEKVILISHSMGGLVSRAASELSGAQGKILGIVHGVQPVTGSAAAYWRIKAGFEGFGGASYVLGSNGRETTPILANSPGGLELLPNAHYRTEAGARQWLTVRNGADTLVALPRADPYEEIYRVPAVVSPPAGSGASGNAYWGLVDPDLLTPEVVPATPGGTRSANDDLADAMSPAGTAAWSSYTALLDKAKSFHGSLGVRHHPNTFTFWGTGHASAGTIRMNVTSNWVRSESYPTRGFRGFFRDAEGSSMQAVLADPAGPGDGTVPVSSGRALADAAREAPGDAAIAVEHQPAYEDPAAQRYTVRAVLALVRKHYRAQTGR